MLAVCRGAPAQCHACGRMRVPRRRAAAVATIAAPASPRAPPPGPSQLRPDAPAPVAAAEPGQVGVAEGRAVDAERAQRHADACEAAVPVQVVRRPRLRSKRPARAASGTRRTQNAPGAGATTPLPGPRAHHSQRWRMCRTGRGAAVASPPSGCVAVVGAVPVAPAAGAGASALHDGSARIRALAPRRRTAARAPQVRPSYAPSAGLTLRKRVISAIRRLYVGTLGGPP